MYNEGIMTGFKTFSSVHILWLIILVFIGALLFRTGSYKCAAAAAVFAVLGRVLPGLRLISGRIYGPEHLPLHVCSLAGYGCFLHLLIKKRLYMRRILGELLFFPGLPGAALALLFPGWGDVPAFSFFSICEFLGHFGITMYVLLQIREGGIRPSFRNCPVPLTFCVLYTAVLLPFDLMTGLNFGFLLYPAPDSPLEWIADAAGGGSAYLAGYFLLVSAVMLVCYSVCSAYTARRPFQGKES